MDIEVKVNACEEKFKDGIGSWDIVLCKHMLGIGYADLQKEFLSETERNGIIKVLPLSND